MEVTFLGSSNAFAAEGRYWSSFLVDKKYLFDAPPTLLPHLKQLQIPLLDIEVLFLTHHHGDHFMGVPFLFLEYMYMTKRTNDLYIVGPPGVEAWIEEFADRCYPNITKDAGYKRIYIDAAPRQAATSRVNQLLLRPDESREGAHGRLRLPRDHRRQESRLHG